MKRNFLLLILLVAFLLRIFAVDSLPRILNRDEAALGYNALLLHETGTDEWGRVWPIALESFGDYKLLGYPALVSILFYLFSPMDWVVRLPAVVAGVWLVYVGYRLAKALSFDEKSSLGVAALLAVQPVFIFYSRMAFEALVGLSFLCTAMWLYLEPAAKTKRLKLDFTASLFVLFATCTYNTPLLLIPLVAVVLICKRGVFKPKNWVIAVGVLLVLFVGMNLVLLPLTSQKKGITLFSDESTIIEYSAYRTSLSGLEQKLFGSFPVYVIRLAMRRYIQTFSFGFLVVKGGSHPWHALSGWGHMVSVVYGLGLVGLTVTILSSVSKVWLLLRTAKNKVRSMATFLQESNEPPILILGLGSIVPAALTVDAPHATRSLLFFVCFMFWAVVGMRKIYEWLPSSKQLGLSVVLGVVCIQVSLYLYSYFFRFPVSQSQDLRVGYDIVLQQALEVANDTETIAVVDPEGYHYILTAWYLKMSPELFKQTVVKQLPNQIGFRYGEKVGQFHFIAHQRDQDPSERILVIWEDSRWQLRVL